MTASAPPSPRRLQVITALTCAAAWTLVVLVMIHRNLLFASGDDYSRTVLSMLWASNHYFFVEGDFWLPLPFWYYGAWFQVLGQIGNHAHWYIPASTLMMFLAGWGLMRLTNEMSPPRDREPEGARMAAGFGALILALTIPYAWRMTTTCLAEPVFLAAMSWLVYLIVNFKHKPARWKWLAILALCEGLMWIRYEGWPIAFIAWAMACHVSHRGPGPRPRFQWQLPAGFGVLSVLPLTLMWIHATRHLDPLHFLKMPHLAATMLPEIYAATTGWRVSYLTALAWEQGWVVMPLFVLGIIYGRRRAETWLVAVLVLFLWLGYYQMAVSNSIGGNPTRRYCVLAIWMCVPIAAQGLARIVRLRPRWLAWLTRTAVAVAIFSQINSWDMRNWGGVAHAPYMLSLAEELAESARERNGYAVIADSDSLGDNINLFRIYMGLDRVVCESWWRPVGLPIKGEFFYFTPRPLKGIEPKKLIAGQYMYVFDQWPIPAKDTK